MHIMGRSFDMDYEFEPYWVDMKQVCLEPFTEFET